MARKKSLKKAKKTIEVSQKSRDRKRILDLIATLVGGEKQGHLSPEEVNGIVSELKSDPQAIPFLKRVAFGKEYGIATKLTALDILKEAGVAIDSELYHSLKATHGLIEESSQYLKEGSEDIGKSELPDRISAQILQLNEHLQRLFLHQLIQEAGEKSLLLLTRLVGKSERFDLIIADSVADLPLPGSADLLSQMAEATRDKALEKTIKRSLYRLRGKGVVVRDTTSEDQRASILRPPAKASEGHLSSIDYLGDRLVLVTQPAVTRGLYFFQALINDTEGMRDFQGMEITRKGHREYLTRLREQNPMEIVEADPSYCQFLIEEGQNTAVQKGYPLPKEFLEWKDTIGKPPRETQKPLIYLYYGEEAIAADEHLLPRIGTLFELPEFKNWMIKPDETKKYAEMIREAGESQLILTRLQKQERISGIYNDAVQDLFDEERRLLYKRRLEEMAYVIYKLGKEEEARICLAAARALKKDGIPSSHHPFLLDLVKRSLSSALFEEEQREKETPSFIVKP